MSDPVSYQAQEGISQGVKATARIDWRKLLVPLLLVMVMPTIGALVLDKSLGYFPFLTIAAIVVCFPIGTIWGMRMALQEMDRVIAEVAPPPLPEPDELSAAEQLVKPEVTAEQVGASKPQVGDVVKE